MSAYHGWLICKEAYFFMATSDRRSYQRLSVQLDILYRKPGPILGQLREARTSNVSVGGVCFRTMDDSLRAGTILEVELRIPPLYGVLETGGRIHGLAQVLRAEKSHPTHEDPHSDDPCYIIIVAARFCHRPVLSQFRVSLGPGPFKDLNRRPGHVHAIVDGVPCQRKAAARQMDGTGPVGPFG